MKLKKMLSTLSAAAMALSCACIPPASTLVPSAFAEEENEEMPIFIPDFPQDVLDEFGINWTGLGANQFIENTELDYGSCHHSFSYDGGYAMYSDQNYKYHLSYSGQWHDCDSFNMCQSKEFAYPDLTDDSDVYEVKPELTFDIFAFYEVRTEGELRFGAQLELNGGSDKLFVIERYTPSTDFSDYEKIGSYTSKGNEYDLCKSKTESSYYAINKNGKITAASSNENEDFNISTSISDHLANLHELAGISTKLTRYGVVTEGNGGSGTMYNDSKLISTYFTLPEKESPEDVYGEDAVYDYNLVKKMDGYRFSFQSSDSGLPVDQLDDGRYVYSQNKNDSYIIPFADGSLIANNSEGITSAASAGKEFDGKTSVLDHNYQYNYSYYIDNNRAKVSAVIWMLDPYVKVEFTEWSPNLGLSGSAYKGSVNMGEERYDIYADYTYDNDIAPLINKDFQSYMFVHYPGTNDQSDTITRSLPITAVLSRAQTFGVEVGNLARISLNVNSVMDKYYFNILRNEIIEDSPVLPGDIYVDANGNSVELGGHTFSGSTDGYMYGFENGGFAASCEGGNNGYFDSMLKLDEGIVYDPESDKHTVMNYNIEHTLDDKYQAALRVSGSYDNVGRVLYVIENDHNFSIDDNIFAPSSFDYYADPRDPKFEYVKSYVSDGHDYDLYKVAYRINSFSGSQKYEAFAAVRKDQAEDGKLSGNVDITDHIINIADDGLSKTPLTEFSLAMDTRQSTGTIKADYCVDFNIDAGSIDLPDQYVEVESDPVTLGDHTFSGATDGYMRGYSNGAFSATCEGKNNGYFDSMLKLDEGVVLDLDSDKHTVIDYKIEHSLDDKYQAAIRLSGTKDNISRFFFIIENNTNFSVDDNIFAPNSFDYYTLPKEPKFEYVKTYTSGGHTYDLYKVNYTISSFGGATKYEAFAAVRKDQQAGGRLRGAVDVTDHLININDEELSTTPLTEFTLAIDTKLSTGSIEAAHAISFDTEVASEEIIGDFNGDNTIDSLDLIVARKALIAQFSDDAKPAPNKPASKKMDVNKNGSFEIADIVMLQSFVMGKINTFPEA